MKSAKIAALALGMLLFGSAGAMAQEAAETASRFALFSDASAFAVGLVIIGAATGIGWLTRSAVESIARQPEMAANIQTAMIISAALIEGVTFFALIILGFIL